MTTAPAINRPSSTRRWLRRALIFCALGALAIGSYAGWKIYRRHLDDRRLQETIAELDAHDPRWRLEQIEADRAVVPDAENSANIIRTARALITPFLPPSAEWVEGSDPSGPAVTLTDEQLKSVIDLFESIESAVTPTLKLERYPRGRHPIAYSPDGIGTLCRHLGDISEVRDRVLRPLLLLHQHEADAAAAVRDCVCIVNLGRSIGDEPFAVSQVVRLHIVWSAVHGVERTLGQATASEADLARLQAVFAEEAARDAWPAVVRGERALLHRAMIALANGTITANALRRGSVTAAPPRTIVGRVLAWIEDRYPPQLSSAHQWALRRTTRILDETSALPWHERPAVVAAICADDADAPELARPWHEIGKTLAFFQESQASARCTLVAIASERHRLRFGGWPDAASELVPEFLAELPLDPFDGRPLRYKRLPDGVVIYSVGAEGVDDGGQISPTLTQEPMNNFGVRLWDANRRRQAPKAVDAAND